MLGLESHWCCVLRHVWLFATPWTVAHQVALSMEFSRQEYWNGFISFYRGSSWLRDWTRVSFISCNGRLILYHWATREVLNLVGHAIKNNISFPENLPKISRNKMSCEKILCSTLLAFHKNVEISLNLLQALFIIFFFLSYIPKQWHLKVRRPIRSLSESSVLQPRGHRTAWPLTALTSASDKIARALLRLSRACLEEISVEVIY